MSLTTQFYTMISMIAMGSWLGAALDTYGRFIKRPKRAHWIVFINDILFWVLQGLIIFYVLLNVNEGELRFYIFVAIFCGYAAYHSLLRSFYIQALERIIKGIIITYRFFTKTFQLFVVKPLKLLLQLFIILLVSIYKLFVVVMKVMYRIVLVFLKVMLAPIKWICILFWRPLPKSVKLFVGNKFNHYAGYFLKIKNMKLKVKNMWHKLRKK